MPQFSPDQCTFQDAAGYGAWDIAHAREHLQFVQVLSQQTPAVLIPDYDFLALLTSGPSLKSIVESHAEAHNQLRTALNISGIDLSEVDLTKSDDFYNWLGYHATEHAAMRQVLGII
jgi:hypothetical protein